jgi:hypothetical protein
LQNYNTHTRHSDQYYFALITALIRSLRAGFTDAQIAQALNGSAILAPSGRPFTTNAVAQLLKKMRNHRIYPSKVHHALLQLCFDGRLNAADTLILFQARSQGEM